MIFGNTNRFAIEIEESTRKGSFQIRLWIHNNSFGKFKRKGRLVHAINNLNELLFHRIELNNPILINASLKDFNSEFSTLTDVYDYQEFGRYYIRFLGDQLDEFPMKSVTADHKCRWIISETKTKMSWEFYIDYDDIETVTNEITEWYITNYGIDGLNYYVVPKEMR